MASIGTDRNIVKDISFVICLNSFLDLIHYFFAVWCVETVGTFGHRHPSRFSPSLVGFCLYVYLGNENIIKKRTINALFLSLGDRI